MRIAAAKRFGALVPDIVIEHNDEPIDRVTYALSFDIRMELGITI